MMRHGHVEYRAVYVWAFGGHTTMSAPHRTRESVYELVRKMRSIGYTINSVVKLTPKQPPATIQDDPLVSLVIPTHDGLVSIER